MKALVEVDQPYRTKPYAKDKQEDIKKQRYTASMPGQNLIQHLPDRLVSLANDIIEWEEKRACCKHTREGSKRLGHIFRRKSIPIQSGNCSLLT
jgi:hypothetical protein